MSYQDISAAELGSFIPAKEPLILDMRDPVTFAKGHLHGALPADECHIRSVLAHKEKPVLICCYHGISSRNLATFLCQMGHKQVYNLEGGWAAYAAQSPSINQHLQSQGAYHDHRRKNQGPTGG